MTTIGLADPETTLQPAGTGVEEQIAPAEPAVTVYPVMAEPLAAGASKRTSTAPSSARLLIPSGASGRAAGTIEVASDSSLVPSALVAVTVKL